jgi:hypothetical protein
LVRNSIVFFSYRHFYCKVHYLLLNFFPAKYPLLSRDVCNELRVFEQFGADLSEKTIEHIINSHFFENVKGLRNSTDSISKSEFILLLLHTMGKLHENDVLLALKLFQKLDTDKSGELRYNDLQKVFSPKTIFALAQSL